MRERIGARPPFTLFRWPLLTGVHFGIDTYPVYLLVWRDTHPTASTPSSLSYRPKIPFRTSTVVRTGGTDLITHARTDSASCVPIQFTRSMRDFLLSLFQSLHLSILFCIHFVGHFTCKADRHFPPAPWTTPLRFSIIFSVLFLYLARKIDGLIQFHTFLEKLEQ